MDPFIKLAGQIAAAGVLVHFELRLTYIPLPKDWGGSTSLDYTLSAIITILVVVVAINAVNFVDGLDGLAAEHRVHRRHGDLGLLHLPRAEHQR
ncbi:hypothetical protein ACFSTC_46595 [Nonomuraea ferruginea]